MLSVKTERGRLWWALLAIAAGVWFFVGWQAATSMARAGQVQQEARV